MKFLTFLCFLLLGLLSFHDVTSTKDIPAQQADTPLTPLNKFDKYFLRMYNKTSRLQQGAGGYVNGVNMKNTVFILYFFAKWCHACKMQGSEMEKLEKYYGKRIYILKVDIDQNEAMARKFAVKSLPTIIIMKNKAVLARKDHYVTSNDLVSLVRKHL
ncbi:thioredoxin 2, putative [Plasmodium knowlesi strain H]|uniref:Thioredoxin 2 n=3 Tax=Plasmodium knowlesi TaxID=5850 RepID=A0A5K1UL48_PLAKH|nr:thioredoxin (thioredoxin-2 precursor) [Plasmodium knowlesi strain H]OTN66471.1 putative Thioredoxin 2 [Plasmodium knowlesi]CAA9989887.1 thioredoxin 2, putative [Plasmodium knowlesi strain H]SBO24448.1 thioredoxin 2, putative [Plasmodium knowlesi strain H]SBO26552.1 thioredoxin 2, putative [Plasmodium knowlesi strain H]VVS79361.1 thioredoxin 2, putative [Plasmodium knowlesi strain H]|eukprot:XP_002259903.1 thioredoxin (thioredoxin-2 precursor) [Plasmodium knowlesi strain H]